MLTGKVDFVLSIKGKKGKAPTGNQKLIILRDQIRIRMNVNAIKDPIGKGPWLTGAVDAAALKQKVVGMVKGERFSKPPVVAIPAAALREAGSAADSVWKQLCDQHNKRARQKQLNRSQFTSHKALASSTP